MHSCVNVLTAAELDTLNWEILCYVYFATIKNKKQAREQPPPDRTTLPDVQFLVSSTAVTMAGGGETSVPGDSLSCHLTSLVEALTIPQRTGSHTRPLWSLPSPGLLSSNSRSALSLGCWVRACHAVFQD